MFCSGSASDLVPTSPLYSKLVFLRNFGGFFGEMILKLSLLGDLSTFFKWDLGLSLDILLFLCHWAVVLQSLL